MLMLSKMSFLELGIATVAAGVRIMVAWYGRGRVYSRVIFFRQLVDWGSLGGTRLAVSCPQRRDPTGGSCAGSRRAAGVPAPASSGPGVGPQSLAGPCAASPAFPEAARRLSTALPAPDARDGAASATQMPAAQPEHQRQAQRRPHSGKDDMRSHEQDEHALPVHPFPNERLTEKPSQVTLL